MIVYFHGFASSNNSNKVTMLKNRFGDDHVIAPNLPFNPIEVSKLTAEIVNDFAINYKNQDSLIFVGTSLGAFYANYFGHLYDCPMVLVNPSVYPSESLKQRLGSNKNYATGEEIFVSLAHLDSLNEMKEYINATYHGSLVNLFLAKDDDVIPYNIALEVFKFTNSVCVMNDGGHRFDKHWDKVLDKIEQLYKK